MKFSNQRTVHHTDFIDDQIATIYPFQSLFATHLPWCFTSLDRNTQGVVQSRTSDIERCRSCCRRNDQLFCTIQDLEPSSNCFNDPTFACACVTEKPHQQLFPDFTL